MLPLIAPTEGGTKTETVPTETPETTVVEEERGQGVTTEERTEVTPLERLREAKANLIELSLLTQRQLEAGVVRPAYLEKKQRVYTLLKGRAEELVVAANDAGDRDLAKKAGRLVARCEDWVKRAHSGGLTTRSKTRDAMGEEILSCLRIFWSH